MGNERKVIDEVWIEIMVGRLRDMAAVEREASRKTEACTGSAYERWHWSRAALFDDAANVIESAKPPSPR